MRVHNALALFLCDQGGGGVSGDEMINVWRRISSTLGAERIDCAPSRHVPWRRRREHIPSHLDRIFFGGTVPVMQGAQSGNPALHRETTLMMATLP
jgi:hypothetical protein